MLLGIVWLQLAVFCIGRSVAETIYCNSTQSCPEEYPCCTSFGECGTGAYCLGSCNPAFSYKIDACMPLPVCKDKSVKFDGYSSKVLDANTYLGNVSSADWIYTGYLLDYDEEGSMILAMPNNTSGSVLSSTRYMWYGKVSARLKTSHLAGVITAFILYSSVEDEIDFEWVGADLNTTQTNFYWQAVLNYTNSANISTVDTFDDYHTYELDWHEDYVKWSVDGVVGRTLYRNETYNATTGEYQFPQTPAKIQISLWPGGSEDNAEGTIAWAGGNIDWDAPDLNDPGYYYMILNEVNITCYDPPSVAKKNGTEAYMYTSSDSFFERDIAIVDKEVMLDSAEGSGMDPKKGGTSSSTKTSKTNSSTATKGSSSSSSTSTSSSTIASEQKTLFFQDMNSSSSNGGMALGTNNINRAIYLILTLFLNV